MYLNYRLTQVIVHFKLLAIVLILSYSHSVRAQEDTIHLDLYYEFPGFEQLFADTTPFVCTIKLDLKKFQREKEAGKYQPAELIYQHNDSLIAKTIRVKPRGIVRKQICAIPPLRFNVQRVSKQYKQKHGASKIKVVSHCNYNKHYIDYLFREYLTYRMYNIITENSFRVRLLKITYIDIGRDNKSTTTWAFMIEPLAVLSERLNSVPIKLDKLGIHYTDSAETDLLSMWQYMIGNTDWSIPGRHNVKIIKSNNFEQPYPAAIPYDFDYSGMVNTHYALPGEGLGIEHVRERLFVGPCRTEEDYEKAVLQLVKAKASIEELISGFPYLKENEKKDMLKYLDSFYNSITRDGFIKYHIATDCRLPAGDQ
jgi:hypothetical protein